MQRDQKGFTLVELIVVILLVSILSVYAASRFSGISSVSAYAAQDQAISIIRQIQLDQMQSNLSTSDKNILEINSSCLGSRQACLEINQCTDNACKDNIVAKRSDVLYDSDIQFSVDPVPNNNRVRFSLLGNPLDTGGNQLGSIVITISSSGSETQLCLNSQGYVSQEACS